MDKLANVQPARDGSLLLWMSGGLVNFINDAALRFWIELEKAPQGLSAQDLASRVARVEGVGVDSKLLDDARSLLVALEEQGVIESLSSSSELVFRIKGDVFRTGMRPSSDTVSSLSDDRIAYRFGTLPEPRNIRNAFDTLHALIFLALYNVVLKLKGFGGICAFIECYPVSSVPSDLVDRVSRVVTAVDRARVWYPFRVLCLQHSAVVAYLLRRAGVNARMVVGGVVKPFYAHAWVQVCETVVNDRQSVLGRYSVFERCLSSSS